MPRHRSLPPALSTIDRTRASPTPRPSAPAGFVEKPCSHTRSRSAGGMPVPLSETTMSSAPYERGGQLDPHPARLGTGRRRVERVVDEVADDRHGIDGGERAARRGRVDRDDPVDAALPRLRRLAEQERAHGRIAVASSRHLVDERLALARRLGEDLDRLVRPAELQERDGGVQAVAVLVRLGAQSLAERAHRFVRRRRRPARSRREVARHALRHPSRGERADEPGCDDGEGDDDGEGESGKERRARSTPR